MIRVFFIFNKLWCYAFFFIELCLMYKSVLFIPIIIETVNHTSMPC